MDHAHISPGTPPREFNALHSPHTGMTCGEYDAAVEDMRREREGYNAYEPAPTGQGTVIVDLVLKDLKDRAEVGLAKYKTYLRADNGRDALVDAYQEAMDLVMYLRQAIEERRKAA